MAISNRTINLTQQTEPRSVRLELDIPHLASFSQTIQAKVSLMGSISKVTSADGKTTKLLYVDFDGSFAGPGKLLFDQDDRRGLFLDLVVFRAWLQADSNGLHDDQLVSGYSLFKDAPETDNQSGSVSSSISIGLSAKGGFSGKNPSGDIGGSLSIGNSHSHQLTDFTFVNNSNGSIVHQEIRMQQLGDGEEYKGPKSLVNEWQSPFVGARLRELPNLAKSNVPIPAQAAWISHGDGHRVKRAQLSVELTAQYRGIDATANFAVIESKAMTKTQTYPFGFPIDFTVVDREES